MTGTVSLGEMMQRAALNTVMGMGTVFVVLIIISLIISLFGFIGKAQNRKAKEAPVQAAAEIPVSEEIPDENLTDDLELVAVIAAAIAASEDVSADSLVVRSIRRKKPVSYWKNV